MGILEDRIAKLEKQVQDLQGSLKLGPQQAGPLPGWFRAAHIEGNQMLINMTDSKAGVSPRISVTDTAGITRAEMGNLASYTGPNGVNSPAMYGFRANDINGNAIFDSLGLIAVAKSLGNTTFGASSHVSTSYTVVGGGTPASISFALTRPGNLMVIGDIACLTSGAVGNFANTAIFMDAVRQTQGSYNIWGKAIADYTNAPLDAVIINAPTGSHTVDVRMQVDAGQTGAVYGGSLFVIQLGS